MINVELFKTEWDKINDKLKEIDAIPKLDGGGDDFTGIEFWDDEIYYKTETYYSGCGTDYYSFVVKLSELNEPIEYFQKKYSDQIISRDLKVKEDKEKADKLKEERELALYKQLQSKFGENN